MRRKLADNYKRIRDRVQAACERSNRQVEDIRVVAVTKTVEVDVIRAALETGILELGESRVQELVKRAGMLQEHLNRRRAMEPDNNVPDPQWHMIGHLQRNKVRQVLPWVQVIHSVDSVRLAEEISTEATRLEKVVPIFVEVNISGEKSKFGIAVGAISYLIEHIADLPGIKVAGLMAMAPLADDAETARPHFRRLREVFEDVCSEKLAGPEFRELSMGMSNDFEVAIEEGATTVRVGRELFEGVV